MKHRAAVWCFAAGGTLMGLTIVLLAVLLPRRSDQTPTLEPVFDDPADAVRQYREQLDVLEHAHRALDEANARLRGIEHDLRASSRRDLAAALVMERATIHAAPAEHDARRARVDELAAEPARPSGFGQHPGVPRTES